MKESTILKSQEIYATRKNALDYMLNFGNDVEKAIAEIIIENATNRKEESSFT